MRFKMMKSRFAGKCKGCGGGISAGADIGYAKSVGALHAACVQGRSVEAFIADNDNDDQIAASERAIDRAERARDDAEYNAGIADVERWRMNKLVYGEEAAERMDIEDDLRRGWDY
jgi:hypothetical protein